MGGEFELHPRISCEISGVASYHGGRCVRAFLWKRLCLFGQLVTCLQIRHKLCAILILKVYKFKHF